MANLLSVGVLLWDLLCRDNMQVQVHWDGSVFVYQKQAVQIPEELSQHLLQEGNSK